MLSFLLQHCYTIRFFLNKPRLFCIIACMAERPAHSPEHEARLAIADYLSVGPEPNFGELEVEALDEWIDLCKDVPSLDGRSMASLAWMHAERAWSRVAEAGLLTEELPSDIKTVVRGDLTDANSIFARAEPVSSPVLASHISVARLSLPMLDLALTGSGKPVVTGDMARYLGAQSIALQERLKFFKQAGTAHDVPGIHSAAGMMLLAAQFLNTNYVPLPSAMRHWSGAGSHYDYWHAVVYDRGNGRCHKVRFAPYGPPDILLIPPAVMRNDEFPSAHGFGTAEALVHVHEVLRLQKLKPPSPPPGRHLVDTIDRAHGSGTAGALVHTYNKAQRSLPVSSPLPPNPAAGRHLTTVDRAVEECIAAQLSVMQGGEQEVMEIAAPRAWYESLSPFLDPGHPAFGGALERAISGLELQAAQGDLTPDDMYTLGWMHMESATSITAQHQDDSDLLVGSFGRAEDLFNEAMCASTEGTSRFYEYAIAAAAAPMYLAIRQQEHVEAAITVYVERLTALTDSMLSAYDALKDKNSVEGQALWHLLQLATVYIALTGEPSKTRIIAPASPRQHGGGNTPRGWDFTVWEWAGPERYEPGVFHGRLSTQEDPQTLEEGVMTFGLKALGQWTPGHDFATLRSVLAEQDPTLPGAAKRVDNKLLSRVRRNLNRLTYEAQY